MTPAAPETIHAEAIKAGEVVANFLRGQDKTSLSQDQKAEWKKLGEQLFGLLEDAGIEIAVTA